MKQINKLLKEQGVEILHEERADGSTTAYFFNDQLIAMKRDRDMSIFQTYQERVSELLNIMLSKTNFEHYIVNGVSKLSILDENKKVQSRVMGKEFTWRVE